MALAALPAPSDESAPGRRWSYRRRAGYYARQAEAIYRLQMREAIMRWTVQGYTDDTIAAHLGQTPATVRRYRKQSMDRAITRYRERSDPTNPDATPSDDDAPPRQSSRRGSGPGPHRPHSSRKASSGDVLDPPDIVLLKRACLDARKRMQPFDEMAADLGISEQDARRYVAEALKQLDDSETTNSELERRLMVEQIDQMIRACHAPATGNHPDLGSVPPVLEAIDRMLKLMKQKADLLGLNQVPPVDITIRLQQLAEDAGYDMLEVQDIARDVLARHKIKLPAAFAAEQVPVYVPEDD